MTRGAARVRGGALEAPLGADLGLPTGDVAGAMRGSYRFLKAGRESILRGLLPSETRRSGRWDGGGCGWSWELSRWYASLWERGPCS